MNASPMPDAVADLLKQIDDIEGLHPVSAWPLAFGWWALAILGVAIFVSSIVLLVRRRLWQRSWKSDAAKTLSDLTKNLEQRSVQATASALSAAIRRIAVQKYSRIDCAGIEGDQWLAWLEEHDPKAFKWSAKGKLLIEAPYAPPSEQLQPSDVLALIQAAKKWVI